MPLAGGLYDRVDGSSCSDKLTDDEFLPKFVIACALSRDALAYASTAGPGVFPRLGPYLDS